MDKINLKGYGEIITDECFKQRAEETKKRQGYLPLDEEGNRVEGVYLHEYKEFSASFDYECLADAYGLDYLTVICRLYPPSGELTPIKSLELYGDIYGVEISKEE